MQDKDVQTQTNKCKQCGEEIQKFYRTWQVFCSKTCREAWHKEHNVTISKEEYERLKKEAQNGK